MKHFLNTIENLNLDAMLTLGMALITILIPLAIAIFDKQEYGSLDKNVILDLIKAKYIIFYIFLIFSPLLFWNTFKNFRIIIIILWGIGIYYIINILKKSYEWLKYDKNKFRYDYLEKLVNSLDLKESESNNLILAKFSKLRNCFQFKKNKLVDSKKERTLNEIEEVWIAIWRNEKINSKIGMEFYSKFVIIIEKLFADCDEDAEICKVTYLILQNFRENLIKIHPFLLVSDFNNNNILLNILEWRFQSWKKLKNQPKNPNLEPLFTIVDKIFNEITERALKENLGFFFFDSFSRFINNLKNKPGINNRDVNIKEYFENLFSSFYEKFFKILPELKDTYALWNNYFPKEWKIKKETLTSSENIIPRIAFRYFINWASDRISNPVDDYDKLLDNVSANLFHEIEPEYWEIILIFVLSSSYNNKSRIESIISRKWNIRFGERLFDDLEMQTKNEILKRNTFELVEIISKEEFFKDFEFFKYFKEFTENLKEYIEELKKLKNSNYGGDKEKEYKGEKLLRLFKEMLEFKENKNNTNK